METIDNKARSWRDFYFDYMLEWFSSMVNINSASEFRFDAEFGAYITYTGMESWNGVLIKKLANYDEDLICGFVRSTEEYFKHKNANFDWYFFSDDKDIQ